MYSNVYSLGFETTMFKLTPYAVHGWFYFVAHLHNNLLLSHFKQFDRLLFFEFDNL